MISLSDIQSEARAAGFALMGLRPPLPPVHLPAFENWLDQKLQAGMEWISKPYSRRLRADPSQLMPDSRTLISLAVLYPPSTIEVTVPGFGRVASYAWATDYHRVLSRALKDFAAKIASTAGQSAHSRVFVDSSPLLERDLAAMSGLGWIGKNTCLISPSLGSYLFLAEILMDIDLPHTEPFKFDRCGTCRRCIDACPTHCIRNDRLIDSNRCISYLTIEHKGLIPADLREPMGAWIFGCDVCQIVCPWNRKSALYSYSPLLHKVLDPDRLDLTVEIKLAPEEFLRNYAKLPIKRAGWESHIRNVIIAAGNSGLEDFIDPLADILFEQPSPLLRSHAAWSLGRLSGPRSRKVLDKALKAEFDPSVQVEIRMALDNSLI